MILITGDLGFIGRNLGKKLEAYVGIDKQDGQDLMICDLPKNIDLIYHLAADAFVEPSWEHPLYTLLNLQLTARLVHEYPNVKIVYANTSASKESSPYGFSKKVSGEYLKAFHKNYVNITLPNVYGEGSGRVVDLFKGKKQVTIYGDGKQVRDYVHVDDVVEGLLKAQNWPTGDYSMGSGIGTDLLTLAKGKKIKFEPTRREDRECIVPNDTPDWKHSINVLDYIK